MIDAEQLAAYIATSDDVERVLDVAVSLVDDALEDAFRPVPESIYDQLVLEVGRNVYDRENQPAGNAQFATTEGPTPVRAPRDPLATVRPILSRYVIAL